MSEHPSGQPEIVLRSEPEPARELRRGYHDRLALLRQLSVSIVRSAAGATDVATQALVGGDVILAETVLAAAAGASEKAAEVDAEVLELLALQSPVARDLRIVLAARDIAQIGDLCLGLCRALAARVGRTTDLLTPGIKEVLAGIGADAAELLRQADAAWTGLDPGMAAALRQHVEEARLRQVEFSTALVGLSDVPVEQAVHLGVIARAYERLTDHADEIAGRVDFAVGPAPGVSRSDR